MNLAKLGLGALSAAQYKLKTAAHNINNSTTEGYNRQSVRTQTAGAQVTGAGYVGRGVEAVTVDRAYDNFLYKQLVNARGQGAALSSYANEIKQLDTLFADRTVGISPAIENFFKSVNAVASAPSDPAAREEMLGQANNVATQMRQTNEYLVKQRNNINVQVSTVVDQVNSYVQRIHDANTQIVKARASASQHEPNDLLDQRDQLVSELNELVGVTVFEQDGRFNLAIGNGQIVLGGDTVYPLRAQPAADDPQRTVVAFTTKDTAGNVIGIELDESRLRGGKLGGLIQYRQEVLDDVQNNLGRLAVGLSAAFNAVHKTGVDLHDNAGLDFFSVGGPRVVPNVASPATANAVSVSVTDANALTADDYRVTPVFNSANAFQHYRITNVTTGVVTDVAPGATVFPPDPANPTDPVPTLDGLRFSFSGPPPSSSDSWLIQPTRHAAADLQVKITDPAKIAAAKAGTGESNGEVGLELARLQVNKTLGNGSMSITEAFSQIVNRVGVMSQQNKTAGKAQESLIQQTYAAQQQVSGVNLNEEYVNLEQYLEQFRAASKLIDVSSNMFDTLLSMR